MSVELLLALTAYAFVTSVTPGPNNIMLLASGVNFGFRRTLPHMLGIALGHAFMVFVVGVGLVGMFISYPPARTALTIISVAYMLWLAWKIAHAAPPDGNTTKGRPLTFLQAAAFQWVNPKAWIMSLGAVTLYAPGQEWLAVAWVAGVFVLVNFPSVSVWALAGVGLRRLLQRPDLLRAFNYTMAGLLVLSLYPVIFGT
ncbi:LysE family translocator [Natronohydrobacter thiooxidans]|jgi:threonine/homoserine/homoserine lactone efflux protein|uniref:LysE family translocator n=1 Tax=Natronohydrobacter thiooxidans TaxID=87172 RepID=UPI0008FF3F25|nr:LysE family translocator [Natronohydrobacter thiooxidans]